MTKPQKIHRLGYPDNRKPPRPWSPEDIDRMIEMREVQRMSWRQIDEAVGRAEGASANKYESLRRMRELGHPVGTGGRIILSDAQIGSREARRAAANRATLTSTVFGDPPPGFSALDQRRQA